MSNYTVLPGDNLSTISQKLGLNNYHQLSGYNTSDPNLIRPGQTLTYGASSPSPSPAPASSPSSGAPTSGGYSANTDDPTLNNYVGQYNQALQDQTTGTQAANSALQSQLKGLSASDANSFTGAADYGNLKTTQDKYNTDYNKYSSAQDAVIQAPVNAQLAARGGMASQVDAAGNVNAMLPAEEAAQYSLALTPDENALTSEQQLVSGEAQGTIQGNALQAAGFTTSMQNTLAALQSKVDAGKSLSNDEYSNYAQLNSAKVNAAAQVQSAQLGLQGSEAQAGATEAAARISASASTANTAATNANLLALQKLQGASSIPGSTLSYDKNGNPLYSSMFSQSPSSAGAGSGTASKYFGNSAPLAGGAGASIGEATNSRGQKPYGSNGDMVDGQGNITNSDGMVIGHLK